MKQEATTTTTGKSLRWDPLAVDPMAGDHSRAGGDRFNLGYLAMPVDNMGDVLRAGGGLSTGDVLKKVPRK